MVSWFSPSAAEELAGGDTFLLQPPKIMDASIRRASRAANLEMEISVRAFPVGLHDDLIPFMVYNIANFREFGYSRLLLTGIRFKFSKEM